MQNLADIVDPGDPDGRTYRQVNLATQHAFPVGSLIEQDCGIRAFVAAHRRDCDGTPLYSLSLDKHDRVGTSHGHLECGLKAA